MAGDNDLTGPHSRPPGLAAINDLELRMRAQERYREQSAGSIAVIKWLAGLSLVALVSGAVGVWRTVAISETRIAHLEEQGIVDRQAIAAIDQRVDTMPTIELRLANLESSNGELARKLSAHTSARRHGL